MSFLKPLAPALSEREIEKHEERLGLTLPPGYRAFLLTANGAEVRGADFEVVIDEYPLLTTVDFILALGPDIEDGVSFDWHLKAYAGRLPRGMVAVARDGGGGLFLEGGGSPAISYLDSEMAGEGLAPAEVGQSWSALMEQLRRE